MLAILACVMVFHFLVLMRIVPYSIVWGGRIGSIAEMQVFELVSLAVNALTMLAIAGKGRYITLNSATLQKIVTGVTWLMVAVFSLNTVGNIFAQSLAEALIFTPLTFIGAILCCRIAMERWSA